MPVHRDRRQGTEVHVQAVVFPVPKYAYPQIPLLKFDTPSPAPRSGARCMTTCGAAVGAMHYTGMHDGAAADGRPEHAVALGGLSSAGSCAAGRDVDKALGVHAAQSGTGCRAGVLTRCDVPDAPPRHLCSTSVCQRSASINDA